MDMKGVANTSKTNPTTSQNSISSLQRLLNLNQFPKLLDKLCILRLWPIAVHSYVGKVFSLPATAAPKQRLPVTVSGKDIRDRSSLAGPFACARPLTAYSSGVDRAVAHNGAHSSSDSISKQPALSRVSYRLQIYN